MAPTSFRAAGLRHDIVLEVDGVERQAAAAEIARVDRPPGGRDRSRHRLGRRPERAQQRAVDAPARASAGQRLVRRDVASTRCPTPF